jgi:SSS family solute:Na+ symporter
VDIHQKLQPLDFVVVAVYVTALVAIGMWVSFKRRGSQDLFLAGRSLGWPNVGLSIFGTNVSPSMMIASCGVAFSTGMVAANFEWLAWWFLMLLAMLFVPYYLTTGVRTMPQFMKRRFGRASYEFLCWYALFTTIILWLGGTLYVSGELLTQITGWPVWVSVVFLTAVATSFTVAGGLAAVVVTDSFQAVLMILGSASLTLIGLWKVGGIDGLVQKVPADYWRLLRPTDDPDYPWHAMLLGYPVMGIWFWCTDQTIVQRVLGARDVRQGQLGAAFAGYLKILTPFIFMLPGMLCFVLFPDLEEPDKYAFMKMVTECLVPGMVGLIVAVLIAAVISTIDSGLNSFSTVFTLDIYARWFRPGASRREIKWMGRVSTVVAALIAVATALAIGTVDKTMFDLLQSIIAFIAPPMAAVFTIGVVWRRATGAAAIWSLVVGSAVSVLVGACQLAEWPSEEFWPHYLLVSFYMFAAISAFMVIVSFGTSRPSETERLPTLKEVYAEEGRRKMGARTANSPGQRPSGKTAASPRDSIDPKADSNRAVWLLWAVLALAMLGIYAGFQWMARG